MYFNAHNSPVIYHNPTSDILNFQLGDLGEAKAKSFEASTYDLSGKRIKTGITDQASSITFMR